MTNEDRFTIQVVNIVDNDDGSATVTFDMDKTTLNFFTGVGILKALTDAMTDSDV